MITFADPVKNPFNDWLRANGVWVAVSTAVILLLVVTILVILSKIKKH